MKQINIPLLLEHQIQNKLIWKCVLDLLNFHGFLHLHF